MHPTEHEWHVMTIYFYNDWIFKSDKCISLKIYIMMYLIPIFHVVELL